MKLIFLIAVLLVLLIICINTKTIETFDVPYRIPTSNVCYNRNNPTYSFKNYNNYILPKISYEKLATHSQDVYKIPAMTIDNNMVKLLISKIKISKSNNKYIELSGHNYSIWNKGNYGKIINKERVHNVVKNITDKVLDLYKTYIKKNNEKILCTDISNCYPKLIDFNILRIETDDNNNFKIYLTFEIYINNKAHSNVFYSEIEDISLNYKINKINLIGIRFEDSINLLPGYDNTNKFINIYSNILNTPYEANKDYLRKSDESTILEDDTTNNKIINKHVSNWNNIFNFQCYGKKAYTKMDCEVDINELGQPSILGVWDRECKYDSECPFYQYNKNYPNRRGGCIKGECELPLGLKIKGKRHYYKNTKPLCYNCKDNKINCCEEQKNKGEYPNLITPDYAFKNDFIERNKYKDSFTEKGNKVY